MTKRQIRKLVLHTDTFSLMFSFVLLWFTISLFTDSNLDIKDLTPHTGQVVKIDSVVTRVKDKPFFKETTQELRITIDLENNYYISTSTKNFAHITSRIAEGEMVTVYTKPKILGIFGLKKGRDICHLTNGDAVIIDYKNYKESISGFFVLTLIVSFFGFITYYKRVRKRFIFEIAGDP